MQVRHLLFILMLIIPASFVLAWSPLWDAQPAVENSHGLFGNPGLITPAPAPGFLFTVVPDSSGASNVRTGIHAQSVGLAFQWIHNHTTGEDQSLWSATLGTPKSMQYISAGLRAKLWASSGFRGNAWSLTPGICIRPVSMLSLGWSGEDWLATHEFTNHQEFGLAIRPLQALTLGTAMDVSSFAGSWWAKAPATAHAELSIRTFEIGVSMPLRGRDSIPWAVTLGIPFGSHQTIGTLADKKGIRGMGISGTLQRRPSPLAGSTWVRLVLDAPLVESNNDAFFSENKMSITDLRRQFEHIELDPSIRGVLLDFDGYSGNIAGSSELRRCIQELRKSGKASLAYLTELRPGTIYAASAADRIVLQPAARVHLRGLSSEVMHYHGFLDWIGVKAEFLRHGRYKSAVEPFTQDSMSTEAQADLQELLGSMWATLRDSIALGRHISSDSLDVIAKQAPLTAKQAMLAGLADTVLNYSDLKSYAHVSQFRNWNMQTRDPYRDSWATHPRIAILTLEGDIVDGPNSGIFSRGPSIGQRTYSELIDNLLARSDLSAIVLRINSPGGSAQASEILWHRIRNLSKITSIPIVASIGAMAASGGYYIACAADKIVAEPLSIVGSIGVFGGKINVSGLLEKLRITPTTVKTHPNADAESYLRGFSAEETKILQASMDETYQRFVGAVSDARGMSPQQVDSLGEGRVFTGTQGRSNGLVDKLGGLDDAIRLAATQAGVDPDQEIETEQISWSSEWQLEERLVGPSAQMNAGFAWLKDLQEPKVYAQWLGDLQF